LNFSDERTRICKGYYQGNVFDLEIPDFFKTEDKKQRIKREEKSTFEKMSAKNKKMVAEKGL